MPLLEVTQTRHVNTYIRLTDATATQVDKYAAFIHASADDVVEHSLAYVFGKDKDFQEFLRTPEAQRITPTLRVRKGGANEAGESSEKKAVPVASSKAQTPVSEAGSKA